MVDTSRRGFLKLMGLTGAAIAVGGPALFTSGEPSALTKGQPPNLLIGGREHLVFDSGVSPLLAPWSRAHYLFPPDENGPGTVMMMRDQGSFKINKNRPVPQGEIRRIKPEHGWTPVGDPSSYTVNCVVPDGDDPHIAFFMAAAKLQDKISSDADELIKLAWGQSIVFVTRVDSPIMAYPHPDRGFYLETHISQFAVPREDLLNADQALSRQGEVPIEAPGDINFKYLMGMERELRLMGMLDQDLHRASRSVFQRAFRLART